MTLHESMLRPFSRWLEPFPDESAMGFFRRLVANEEHNSAAVYAREIGLDGDHPDPEEILQAVLALPIAEAWKERLRRATPVRRGNRLLLAGEELRPRQLSITARRYCPGCLYEAAYDRAWWDILSITTCPRHNEPLVDRDEHGRPQRWWWPYVGESRWGGSLGRRCSVVGFPSRSLSSYVLGRLGFSPKVEAPILDRFALHEAIESCKFACSLVCSSWDAADAAPADVEPEGDIETGFAMLSGSRAEFVDALRAWIREQVPPHIRERGFDVVFRTANVRRRTYLSRGSSEFFRRAMHKAVAAANRREQKPFTEEDFQVEEFGIIALAGRLGIQQRGVAEIAERVGVMPDRIWAKARVHFSAEETEQIEEFVAGLTTYAEEATILDLPRFQVKPFVDAGLLERIPSMSPRGSRSAGLIRAQVQELLHATLEPLRVVPRSGPHSLVTAAGRMGLEVGMLAALATAGKIKPVGRVEGALGFRKLRFDLSQQLPKGVEARTPVDGKAKSAQRRLQAIKLAREIGAEAASDRLGIRRETFDLWKTAFDRRGLEGLRELKYAGRHPQTTPAKTKTRIKKIALRNPEYGCDRISAALTKEGTTVSSATVQKVLIGAGLGRKSERLEAAQMQTCRGRNRPA
jgi:transposase